MGIKIIYPLGMTHPEGVSLGRRWAAISLDWLSSYVIAFAFFAGGGNFFDRVAGAKFSTPLIFISEYAILVALTGSSFGHRVLRLKVVNYADGGAVSPLQAITRTILIGLVITAITFDEEGRGIHERLSRSKLQKR